TEALREVQRQLGESRTPEALAAAEKAGALLASGTSSDDLSQLVAAWLTDLKMLAVLEDLRLRVWGGTAGLVADAETRRAYAQAFDEYGIPVATLEEEDAGRRLRARAVAVELAAALDDWAFLELRIERRASPGWKRLLRIARATDADLWRNRLRQVVEIWDE